MPSLSLSLSLCVLSYSLSVLPFLITWGRDCVTVALGLDLEEGLDLPKIVHPWWFGCLVVIWTIV